MRFICLCIGFLLFSCQSNIDIEHHSVGKVETIKDVDQEIPFDGISLLVLGNVQDAGSPQIGCQKKCCKALYDNGDHSRKVVSLGLLDHNRQRKYLFDASPDIPSQLELLNSNLKTNNSSQPDGIFLTHAHIGHYTGLMYLGKEAMNARSVRVYTMPRMSTYLSSNGPWDQLIHNGNIDLHRIHNRKPLNLSSEVQVIPLNVPHRDEYSETVGFKIIGPNKSAIYIPDIDKWEKWDFDIAEEVNQVDYAFLDATFYDGEELKNRDMSEIPHPFVVESMKLFDSLSAEEKRKIYFIHMNHTNPLLNLESEQSVMVKEKGFNIARIHDHFQL